MLEAVEASRWHFFENWLMKLKFPHLLKPLGTIIQQNHGFFYPPGPFSYDHFNVIHPVQWNKCKTDLKFFFVTVTSTLDSILKIKYYSFWYCSSTILSLSLPYLGGFSCQEVSNFLMGYQWSWPYYFELGSWLKNRSESNQHFQLFFELWWPNVFLNDPDLWILMKAVTQYLLSL